MIMSALTIRWQFPAMF